MHTIYHTDAFVLDEKPFGEAGKLFALFTRELGLVYATAQGVRYEKSKLRFSLCKYAKVHVALVQGKTGWKITNAYADENLYYSINSENKFRIVARVFALLKRLIQGEETNKELFESLDASISFLKNYNPIVIPDSGPESRKAETLKRVQGDIVDIEAVIVLRLLNHLGYIGDHKDVKFFVVDNNLDNQYIEEMNKNRQVVLKEINRAIKESQL